MKDLETPTNELDDRCNLISNRLQSELSYHQKLGLNFTKRYSK